MTAALMMTGFCKEEVNPPGPVQLKPAPLISEAASDKLLPWHSGLFVVIAGAAGKGLIVAVIVEGREEQPFTIAVTE